MSTDKPFLIPESVWIRFCLLQYFSRPGLLVLLFMTAFVILPLGAGALLLGMGVSALPIFILPGLLLWMAWSLIRNARTHYRTNQIFSGDSRVQITEDAIKIHAPKIEGEYPLSSILKAFEFSNRIAVFPATGVVFLIPKEAFAESEMAFLRNALARRMKRPFWAALMS